MTSVTVEEVELLSFFGVVPKLRDPGEPWIYNDALYEASVEGSSVSFALAPSYKDVRLIVTSNDTAIYEFNGVGVHDVRYHSDGGRETLEVQINERDRLWLKIRPSIRVQHESREPHQIADI